MSATQTGQASGFPVNLILIGQPVLVVGGGPVAARKVAALAAAGARVTVVAPTAVDAIAGDARVRWHQRLYQRGEVASYRLAVTATDDAEVNAQVARDGSAAGVFVNSADDPANCTFTLPSVVRRGDLQVAVSTNGRSPALSRWVRRQLEQVIGDEFEPLLDVVAAVRAEVAAAHGTTEVAGWENALDDELLAQVRAGDLAAATERLRTALGLSTPRQEVGS
ncbi:MAG: bifunctional precorrin-2 dehydrogenase/sirohydrochlorin ferrochelatase [Acidimicrobiales bacterium]|nr:bifunctional precorrin-2 dehydrogenase/sirohydrochlorin ferrochelatase [Acidimicrobiales bacterium]